MGNRVMSQPWDTYLLANNMCFIKATQQYALPVYIQKRKNIRKHHKVIKCYPVGKIWMIDKHLIEHLLSCLNKNM